MPNSKRLASVHQALVCQRYKISKHTGTSTACVENAVSGLYADKDENEARSFFISSVDKSKYRIRLSRRNSTYDRYRGIRDQTQKIKQSAENM